MTLIRYTQPSCRVGATAFARSPWGGLETQMERLFDAALGAPESKPAAGFPVELHEDAAALYVQAELPGVKRADIQIELTDGCLVLSAKRVRKLGAQENTTELQKKILVPAGAVQADKISAQHEDGLLTVTLPRREETKPRKIEIS